MKQSKLEEFRPLFYPQAIAVVGASANEEKFGTRYLAALVKVGYKGKLYPVNPTGGRILGLDAYPNVSSIPGPVDYVIVSIPARTVPALFDDCAAKGVKVAQLFTAGFSETGEEEGRRLEEEIVSKARKGGFRIIGPNCIGVYSPASFMPYGPLPIVGVPGSVAFVSQSGEHAGSLIRSGQERGIRFSKVVSFGNGPDLDSVDYLEYFAVDPETKIIGAYLEGVKDGRRFFELAKEISKTKPMIVWKGGSTRTGAQAAASHTGSLAGSEAIWTAALKQAGAIKVENLEEMADTMLGFQYLPPFRGDSIAIVCGLYGGGGGISVSSSDACTSQGLNIPTFADETRAQLKPILPEAGTILRNPLDMGSVGWQLEILRKAIEIVLADPGIELVIIHLPGDSFVPKEILRVATDIVIDFSKIQSKPIVALSPPVPAGGETAEVEPRLSAAQIPVFPTFERAAKALVNISRYWKNRESC